MIEPKANIGQSGSDFISAPAADLARLVSRLQKNPDDRGALVLLMVLSKGPVLMETPLGMVARRPDKYQPKEVYEFSRD